MEPRLRASLWVQATLRRLDLDMIPAVLVRRGDPQAGTILVRLNRFPRGCMVMVQATALDGSRAWSRGTGPDLVTEAEADAYLERSLKRDPDAWVIEIDDPRERVQLDAPIL
ncbi:DUF1491 family protein [Zavarzinia sp. CC-PAN008]|uniref:DUF1491 family protein n=1 Tax=Zavarzinia sp. CC-PAN008 TaxID=3243332 RepID=UPI003F743EF3